MTKSPRNLPTLLRRATQRGYDPRFLATFSSLVSLSRIIGTAPEVAKWLVITLLLINAGGLPLVWHLRLFSALLKLRLAQLRQRVAAKSGLWKGNRGPACTSHSATLGLHPFYATWSFNGIVWPYQSDFNLHMSNSSYPAALDTIHSQLALRLFPTLFEAGGRAALGGTHFSFVRELPIMASYEVRVEIGAWDEKWIWIMGRFVKPVSSAVHSMQKPVRFFTSDGANGDVVRDMVLKEAVPTEEKDDAVEYSITVSQIVFKYGRLTIPPAVVLATSGFFASPDTCVSRSARTIPPYWSRIQELERDGELTKAFYQGGWRSCAPEDRFWEQAFEACDAERRERLLSFARMDARSGISGVHKTV